jgi:hypothetical protein
MTIGEAVLLCLLMVAGYCTACYMFGWLVAHAVIRFFEWRARR